MGNSLIINRSPSEVRVALLENGSTAEVYVERSAERGVVGNVYRGKVVRVLPGMQAAFVEVGLDRTGFLYVNDAVPRDLSRQNDGEEGAPKQSQDKSRRDPVANIADVLKQGQEILVQVQKEPLGTKGARLTRHITIPGRHVVFMPFSDHVGVSLRIDKDDERARLKEVLEELALDGTGFIVRTAAEDVEGDVLAREGKLLIEMWKDIEKRGNKKVISRKNYLNLNKKSRKKLPPK